MAAYRIQPINEALITQRISLLLLLRRFQCHPGTTANCAGQSSYLFWMGILARPNQNHKLLVYITRGLAFSHFSYSLRSTSYLSLGRLLTE